MGSRFNPTGQIFISLILILFRLPLSAARSDRPSFGQSAGAAEGMRSRGDLKQSLESLKQDLAFARRDKSLSRQGEVLMRIGLLKWDLGEIAEAAAHFNEAVTVLDKAGNSVARAACANCLEVICLYNQGKNDRKAGLPYRSIARFEEACLKARDIGVPDFELKCLRQQSLAYLDIRQLDLFFECNRKGLEIATEICLGIEQGRCLNNIGVYYQWKNDYSQAVTHVERAVAVSKASGDPATEAECLNNLGLIYRELGNYDLAQYFLTQALDSDRRFGDGDAIAVDLVNIGSVLLSRGIESQRKEDLLGALNIFQECLRIQRKTNASVMFTVLNNIGIILDELKEYDKARHHFNRALSILDIGKNTLERCHALSNIGASYLDEMKIGKAFVHFREAFELSLNDSFDDAVIESSIGLARCYERMKDRLTALTFYRRAIDAIERMRGRISSENARIGFARNKRVPYERSLNILIDLYTAQPSQEGLDDIFSIIEKARARAFLESVRQVRCNLPSASDPLLEEKKGALSRNIAKLKATLTAPVNNSDARIELMNELELEEEEYVRLIQEKKGPERTAEKDRKSPVERVDIVRRSLKKGEVLLEYWLGEERSCLVSVSPEKASFHTLPGRKRIEDSLKAYLRAIADLSLDPKTGYEAADRIGRELMLVEAIEKLERARTIIVVPDGILHYLPFEALRIPAGIGTGYLMEHTSIAYCPSASALIALRSSRSLTPEKLKKNLLAIGGARYQKRESSNRPVRTNGRPADTRMDFEEGIDLIALPFSRKEIFEISKAFPSDSVDVLTGDNANEAAIKVWPLTDYRIVHFAGHGFLNERYPFRSALVLSPGDGSEEDGFLQMREIYGLTFDADLVVLSACQTGRGFLEISEGPMGLSRPFFFAGARSVLASLWPIDDQAAEKFMSLFYNAIAEGAQTADALTWAKRQLLRSRWAHPFYWATFLLQGDPSFSRPYQDSSK